MLSEPLRKPDLQIVQPSSHLDRHIQLFLHAKSGKASKTQAGYQSVLSLFRAYTGPVWPVEPEHIDAFLNDCKARGLKETTVDDYYSGLKIWLTWLHKRGHISANPVDLAEKPPHPKLLPRAPQRSDLKKFFDHLITVAAKGKGHWLDVRALALWSLALDSGLRVGELARIRVQDVTLEKKRRNVFIPGKKTHQDRVIVLHKATGKDLKQWLKVRKKLKLPPGLDALFVSDYHGEWRALTDSGMRQDLAERLARLGLPHYTPHQFRNAYAVLAIRNRTDLLDVQRQMGHANIATTARYTLVDDEGRQERHNGTSPRGNL